jgi:transcriptional regulator with XRE-family HTH domain
MSKTTISQNVDFGKAIRAAQASSHTRISDIAKEIGVAPQQVSRWQKSEDIKLSRAVQIAGVFGMTLADFLDVYHE